jgi:hypothetical protein
MNIILILYLLCVILILESTYGLTRVETLSEIVDENINHDNSGKDNQHESNRSTTQINEEYDELQPKIVETVKGLQLEKKKNSGAHLVKKIMKDNLSDQCDFIKHPLRRIQGKLCGSHYKVLDLDRFSNKDSVDKMTIKKSYRQLSLGVHPDKNPDNNAPTAFKIVQEAYECLSNDDRKSAFDQHLLLEEERIQIEREFLKLKIAAKTIDTIRTAHQYATRASDLVLHGSKYLWELADDYTIEWNETEIPIGKMILSVLAVWQVKLTAPILGLSLFIAKMNDDFVKQRHRKYYPF